MTKFASRREALDQMAQWRGRGPRLPSSAELARRIYLKRQIRSLGHHPNVDADTCSLQHLYLLLRRASAPSPVPDRIRDVTCPQCRKPFMLNYCGMATLPETLQIRSCPSGGIYDVSIACPHCDYVEEL